MKQILPYLSIMFLLVSCDGSKEKEDGPKPPEITHQWEQVPTFSGIERENATSFVIADKFYVGLGRGAKKDTVKSLNDFYEYNPTSKTWKQIADFPGISRQSAIGFTLNNKGYVGIGLKFVCAVNRACEITDLMDFWEYDPLNNNWKKVATFDIQVNKRWIGSVVTLNNKAYILYDNFIWEFDTANYTLTKKAKSPEELTFATSFTLNNKGYFGTGEVMIF
jgi:N-acetylneuraminic acid mutarotase